MIRALKILCLTFITYFAMLITAGLVLHDQVHTVEVKTVSQCPMSEKVRYYNAGVSDGTSGTLTWGPQD